jgi:hypothetical protein
MEALASGAGPEAQRLATLDHVMKCAACQQDFELFRALHGAGRSERPAVAPRWYAIAAAAVLVVGIAFFASRDAGPVMRGDSEMAAALVSPVGDVPAAEARRFVWRAVPNAERYAVEVLERGGGVRASATLSDTVWQLPDSVQIRSGDDLEWLVRAEMPDGRQLRSPVTSIRLR